MEKRAVIYTRVSDVSQIENNSLDSQEDICTRYATSNGYEVIKVFREEGVSAKHVSTRPELREAINFSTKKNNNINAIIVYKIDRFSRNVEEGLATISLLAKYKVGVISATESTDESAMGRAMRTIVMTVGELDNALKGERVKDNMQAVFRDGLWPFKCPIGYKRQFKTKEENKGKVVLLDTNLAPIITDLFMKASKGIYNKTQLAKIMNDEGFGKYYKTKANHKIVRSMLSRSFYYGKNYSPRWDEYAIGRQVPLIDEITWQKAYHYVVLKKKKYNFHDETAYPLKGSLICEYCHHPMTTSPSKGRNGVVNYYECKKNGCSKLRINASEAHKQFRELLAKIQPTQRVIKLFNHMVFKEWDTVINENMEIAKRIEKHIKDLNDELRSIKDAKDDGIYTKDEARSEADRVRQEMNISAIEKSDVKIEEYDARIVREFTSQFLQDLTFLWNNLDLPKRQAFLQKVFEGKIVCDKNKQIRTIELSPSFELIQALESQNTNKVPLEGIEPSSPP